MEDPKIRHGRVQGVKPIKFRAYKWGLSKSPKGPRRGTIEGRDWLNVLLPATKRKVLSLSAMVQRYAGEGIKAVGYGRNAATLPEVIVYGWLVAHKYRDGVDFTFQSSMQGGRLEAGGMVVDFMILCRTNPIAIRVQGGHWHTGGDITAKDEAQKLVLTGYGYTVVDLWEEDIYIESILDRQMEDALGTKA